MADVKTIDGVTVDVPAHTADLDAHISGGTAGQLLVVTGATTAALQNTGVKLTAPDIQGTVTAAATLTMPAFTAGGDISLGANKLKTTNLAIFELNDALMQITNAAGDTLKGLYANNVTLMGSMTFNASGAFLNAIDSDAGVAIIRARDTGVAVIEIGRWVGAADPYVQIGRDDTGVALNAVTDMLVLQAGGGTGNEAANFGLGTSWKIGNASSEVEERGSIDLVLQTATNASEDASWIFKSMVAGSMVTVMSFGGYAGVSKLGFYATAPVALQTGVAVSAAGIHTALVNLGLITA